MLSSKNISKDVEAIQEHHRLTSLSSINLSDAVTMRYLRRLAAQTERRPMRPMSFNSAV